MVAFCKVKGGRREGGWTRSSGLQYARALRLHPAACRDRSRFCAEYSTHTYNIDFVLGGKRAETKPVNIVPSTLSFGAEREEVPRGTWIIQALM